MIDILKEYNDKYNIKKILHNENYVILKDIYSVNKFIKKLYASQDFNYYVKNKEKHESIFVTNFLMLKNTFKIAYMLGYKDRRYLLKINNKSPNDIFLNVISLDMFDYRTFSSESNFIKADSKDELQNLKVYDPISDSFYFLKRGVFKWRKKK